MPCMPQAAHSESLYPLWWASPQNFKNRYNEHIRYTRYDDTQAACAVHILSNGHKYGPIDGITKLAKPCTGRM
jgi:hypothetical protein